MLTTTGKHKSLQNVRRNGLENGMKKPMMMPSKSIKIIKLEPQRGWKRFCFRTVSTVSGRSFS